jgi:steroid delta-isomerase-like uncharacterized protein
MAGEATVVKRFIEEILDTGDWSSAGELLQPDVVLYHPSVPEPIRGLEAFQGFLSSFRVGMPDLHFEVGAVAGDAEYTAARWTATGTHTAEMFGIPPTGNEIHIHGISFFRLAEGKIAEDWVEENTLSVLQQLGVMPPLG